MEIKDFEIERYFSKYEFSAKYIMSASDCDGLPLKYILSLASDDEMTLWDNIRLGYTETRGSIMLRGAIAKHYENIGTDNIIVCSPGEANFSLMNVLLKSGDEVICMKPLYQSLFDVASGIGCRIKYWEPEYSDKKWRYDPGKLKNLISKSTRLIVINFPHNPTGFSPAQDEFKEIVKIASENGTYLFSDEMYRQLVYEKNQSLPSACDLYENAVSLWGTSKSFGLAGLRLGWLTSRNKKILDKVESFKDYLSICNSLTNEIPALIALNNSDEIISNNIRKIKSNIELFRRFSERNDRFIEFPVPESGSTAFAKLKINIPARIFTEKVVEETGILLLPSETLMYGSEHIRIGFGRESFPEAIVELERYINSQEIKALYK